MDAVNVQTTLDAVLARDIRASARLITRAESGDAALRPVLQALYRHGGHARVVGITGPPGAGKSTLVDQLVAHYRAHGKSVAVLAVDPSSPFSKIAELGAVARATTPEDMTRRVSSDKGAWQRLLTEAKVKVQ